ncbi:hypothetical protein MSLAZ_1313 [Methanosarcina lacustris Z-7289]|uniref:Uncharacterized protein n=1 Tax=Methanosarcina lacustris Z-7289 TaxID=1434111 RepID=A0A0E3S1H8_9EURY|nr:hypothetical protein [Methanosarcina lacustris]AKB74574.1 hypothetical protein MSLAZ_1313 [Methanosarcina lacustris Z-7289]
MSIIKEKPQLDPVLKAHPGAIGQEIKQKNRHDDALKLYSCLKEFETVNFETLNPKRKFSIQSVTYPVPPNPSSLSGKLSRVEESGFNFLQAAERSRLNFNQLTVGHSVVTGRAPELRSCPEAPESEN